MKIDFNTLAIPLLVLMVLLAVLIVMWLFARNYIKVPPNAAAVFSGRKRKLPDGRVVGYRMVRGGAALRIPQRQPTRAGSPARRASRPAR